MGCQIQRVQQHVELNAADLVTPIRRRDRIVVALRSEGSVVTPTARVGSVVGALPATAGRVVAAFATDGCVEARSRLSAASRSCDLGILQFFHQIGRVDQ